MKVNLKKMLGLTALGMTLLSNTVPTWAGSAGAPGVSIQSNSTETTVYGSLTGARFSADGTQYIGCSINAAPYVYCYAQDSAGRFVGCVSYDAQLIGAVQTMTDSSSIRFDVKSGSSACTFLGIADKSYFLK